jgi:NTE family protein
MIQQISRLAIYSLLLLGHSLPGQVTYFEENIFLPTDTSGAYRLENLTYHAPRSLKVALVLSGGGARGLVHLGVLQALEEQQIPLDLIVGSSIGSVIGGFYAAGYGAEDLIRIFREIDWENLFSDQTERTQLFWSQKTSPRKHLLELRFDEGIPYIPSALSPGQKIFDIIYTHLLNANFQSANDFDNLRIPFRAVATDLLSGQRVVLDHGDLAEAISGSMAVPLLFAPVEWDGMWLADGGIRDNLPVDVAIDNGANLTIAVDATAPLRSGEQMKSPWQIADQVTTIMIQESTQQSRSMADILISPEVSKFGSSDFAKIDSLILQGYHATIQMIDSIQQAIRAIQENFWGENYRFGNLNLVSISGLDSVLADSLAKSLEVKEGQDLRLYDIYKDLTYLYQTGSIENVHAFLKGTATSLSLQYVVKENPPVQRFIVKTNQINPDSLFYEGYQINLNRPVNYRQLFTQVEALLNSLFASGYSLARVVDISYESELKTLEVRIDEGSIKNIEVNGNITTKDEIIFRELLLKEGRAFRSREAVESLQNIYSTGLFDRVTLNVVRNDSTNSLIFRVKEKKYLLLRVGLNASLERKAKAFMELAEDNLFGREIKASLFGMIGDLEKAAEFKLYSVRLLKTYLTYRFSLYYQERWDRYYQQYSKTDDYLTIRRGLNFVLGQQIARLGSIGAEFRWENISIFAENAVFPYADNYKIRSFTVRSVVDKRDKLPFPNRGIYNRWFWETGNKKILGGSSSFTRFFIGLEGYYPLYQSLIYRIRGMAGSGDLTLPFSEFFVLGGMADFPGLYEREKFGRQMAYCQNELRYAFPWDLPIDMYLGANFNVGAVWESSEDQINKSDFLTSWSAYLAVNSLLGPIQLMYGKLTNIRDIIYFSIGYEF